MASVKVKVLVNGIYARDGMREVVGCQVGDVVEISSGWYVDKMIAQGRVELASESDALFQHEVILEEDKDDFGEEDNDIIPPTDSTENNGQGGSSEVTRRPGRPPRG